MIKTRLQIDLENINKKYDETQAQLEEDRRHRIDMVWDQHIKSGTLKQDLS